MRYLPLTRWIAILILAIALSPSATYAQEPDTLSISGTFGMDELRRMVGPDLASVYANDSVHGWTLTLYGVSYSHDRYYLEWNDEWGYGYREESFTGIHAATFDFQFFGPDAEILNDVVSQQFVQGGLYDAAFLGLWNIEHFDSNYPDDAGPYSTVDLGLLPLNPSSGIQFHVASRWWNMPLFPTDWEGYPLVEPRRVDDISTLTDLRTGNDGEIVSYSFMDIGSPVPPVWLPALSIADGSAAEGHKGMTRLVLTVTLCSNTNNPVTVSYSTLNGSALASDYATTSGTLTIPPGETQGTISIDIKGDRKREPNETFSVLLSNAEGATINDGFATATILNDD